MAVMPMPMARSLLLLLLLATPFFLLSHPSSSSASLPDVDLNYLIQNGDGHAPGANDHDEDQELFAADDDRRTQEDPEGVNEAHVVALTTANFSSFLAVRRHVVVDGSTPRPHLVAKGLDVALAKVDATQERQLARAHGVEGYPTVLFFVDGVPRHYPYYGERSKDAMVAWISQRLDPEVQNVTTIDEIEKIINGRPRRGRARLPRLPLGCCAHGDELAAASRLEDINSLYRAVNFYQTTSPDVAKLFHVDPEAKRPSLVLLNKQEEKLTVYDGEFRASAIAEFVSANKIPLITYHPHTGSHPSDV